MLFRNMHKQHYIGAQLVYRYDELACSLNVHVISTVELVMTDMYIDVTILSVSITFYWLQVVSGVGVSVQCSVVCKDCTRQALGLYIP